MRKALILTLSIVFSVLAPAAVFAESIYYDPSENFALEPGSGKTYYVDGTNGNNSYNGLAATYQGGSAGPFKTIGKALDRYSVKAAGDRVLIRKGIYYERISLPDTYGGTAENPFAIGAYGDGEVIIDGSVTHQLGSWSAHNSSIYKCQAPGTVANVIIDGNFKSYRPVPSLSSVSSFGKWYYDSSSKTLYVHTNGDNPSNNDVIVVPDYGDSSGSYGIYIPPKDHRLVYGLTVRGSPSIGIFGYQNKYIRIEKCKSQFHAKSGILLSSDSQIIKCQVNGNVMWNWPRGRHYAIAGGGWPAGLNIGSRALARGNIVFDNGGEGILSYMGSGNNVIEYNKVYDNFSVNVYVDNQINPVIRHNYIYSTGINLSDISEYDGSSSNKISMSRRLRPEGIMTADENYGLTPPAKYSGGLIYGNVIYGCRRGITHYGQASGSGIKYTKVVNNTIIVPNYNPSGLSDSLGGIAYGRNSGNNIGSIVKNNVIVGGHSGTYLVAWLSTNDSNDSGIQWDNNVFYHPNSASPFRYKGASMNFSTWKTSTGQDSHSKYEDPKLKRADWSFLD